MVLNDRRDDKPTKRRSPALLATIFTLPIMLVVGLIAGLVAVNSGKNDPGASPSPTATVNGAALPALTVSAPPSNSTSVAPCTKVLAQLPVSLGDLPGRVVHPQPDSPFVVAWGDPAVVLRCGVARPNALHPGSSEIFPSMAPVGQIGPFYAVTTSKGSDVFTTVDRAVYVEITVPAKYSGGTYVPLLSAAIDKALPAVCVGGQPETGPLPPASQLCANRP